MNALQQWNRCPDCIEIGETGSPIRLLKRNNLYGIRSTDSARLPADVEVEPIGEDFSIAFAPPSSSLADDMELLPVYATEEGSTPAIATRRIFLRLDEHTTPQAVEAQLHALGFLVAEIPAYAPHAAWIEPASGRIDEALSKLERLRSLPHTAHAEPQLVRPKGWKHDSERAPRALR